jgi:hypothetical protein
MFWASSVPIIRSYQPLPSQVGNPTCQYHSTNAPNSFTYRKDYTVSPVDSVIKLTHFKRMLAIKETDKTHQLII